MTASSEHPDLWKMLLAETARMLDDLDLVVSDKELTDETRTLVGQHLTVMECGAWMAGSEDLADVTRACRWSVASWDRESLTRAFDLFRQAIALMQTEGASEKDIFESLDRLREVTVDVEPDQPVPDEAPSRAQPESLDEDQVWVPLVDQDLLPPFVEECTERLQGLTGKLLSLEQEPGNMELVADIFRDLHTVKGSSAFVGLTPLNHLSHAAEDLVGQVRDEGLTAGSQVIDTLLNATDLMGTVLEQAVSGQPLSGLGIPEVLASLKTPHGPPLTLPKGPPRVGPKTGAGGGRPAGTRPGAFTDGQTIRVDFPKLDLLLNLVGELVLDKAALRSVQEGLDSTIRAVDAQSKQLRRSLWGRNFGLANGSLVSSASSRPLDLVRPLNEELGRVERVLRELTQDLDLSLGRLDFVSGELRDQVMKLRMVPIASVFAKHRRTVRDLTRTLGKRVRLELKGQETELDKMLVEHLDEPLLHLVRNAIDHGMERPEDRVQAGKPEEGVLKLKAEQRGSQFVVEISDDGKGISAEQLRRKAVERGVLTAQRASELTDQECLDMVFSAGFSTAKTVTDLSGRGVGLDVVKEVVSRLRGTVEVASTVGKGTTFTLSLPLTLAIRQVLLLRVAGELTALPIDHLQRSIEVHPDQIRQVVDREVLQIGDRHLPLIWLHRVLGLGAPPRWASQKTLHVIQVRVLGHRYGLVCDSLEGKREIVIKSLGDLLSRVDCVAGATLVGDRVVLILDLPDLVRTWIRAERSPIPESRTTTETSRPTQRKVLLAEDSPPMRRALKEQFQQIGFEVTEAGDGIQALERAKATRFDLVSTDAMMPNMDGYELTRELRRDPKHKEVPIVMISVRGERIDKVRGFDAGVDAYLVKPADPSELAAMVQRLLGTRPSRPDPEEDR